MQHLKHTLCLLIFFWQCIPSEAQQLPYQTQFRQLYAYINPASISSDYFLYEYNTTINASYRLQWAAQPQTPRTFYVGGEYIHNRNQNGAGFNLAGGAMLLRDRVGPLSLTGVSARIASLFAEDPYFGAFSVGFSFGMTQYRLLHDRIVWETLDESEKEPGVAFTTQGKPTLASLAGCWEGESLERGPQGDYETRQEFE